MARWLLTILTGGGEESRMEDTRMTLRKEEGEVRRATTDRVTDTQCSSFFFSFPFPSNRAKNRPESNAGIRSNFRFRGRVDGEDARDIPFHTCHAYKEGRREEFERRARNKFGVNRRRGH